MSEDAGNVEFLVLVTARKRKDTVLAAIQEAGVHLINTAYGKGTVNASYLMKAFGLVPEKDKTVITCVSTCVKIDIVLKTLNEKVNFDRPNTAIAFTIPVDQVLF